MPGVDRAISAMCRSEPELAGWWRRTSAAAGREAALSAAWEALEGPSAVRVAPALTVEFFDAVAGALGFDPGLLSRGCVAIDSSALGAPDNGDVYDPSYDP